MNNNLTWILVMDGSHARIFQKENRAQPLIQLQALSHTHEPTHEHGHDKPGRAFESGNTARHAYEPKTDWHDNQKEIFIGEIFDLFVKEYQEKKFKKAYIICPPKILGSVRAKFSAYTEKLPETDKIDITEISKDLAHHTLQEIEEAVLSGNE